MSFSRAKITRFNDQDTSISKQPSHSGNMNKTLGKSQKTEKWASSSTRSAATKSSSKPRSLSQPSSNTIINKQSQRPYSGGDEKTRQNKTKHAKPPVSDKYGEEEEYETVNIEKPSSEQIYKIEENTDDEINSDDKDLSSEPRTNGTTCKASSSGIPLRIKQQQNSPRPNVVNTPRKASPRVSSKSNVTSIRSNENSAVKLESPKIISPAARRNLEMQYQLKKKRMDQLKKEITDRHKLLTDSYQALIQLNKKLEEAGKSYPLDELKPNITVVSIEESKSDNEPAPPPPPQSASAMEMSGGGEDVQKAKIDPNTVHNMKETIKQIPITLLDMCRNLISKRLAVVNILDKVSTNSIEQDELQQNIQDIKEENASLEKTLDDIFDEQEKNVMDLVEKWQSLLMNSGDYSSFMENIENMKETIEQKEQQILKQTAETEDLRRLKEEAIINSEKVVSDLKDKIKSLEHELNVEKSSVQETKDKANLYDQRMKLLKTRIKEMEGKQKETESKCIELQKAHRHAQDQLRANEHRWIKEKEELLSKHKHDRQMLDKLTKDRSYFETRMKTLEELVEDKENKLHAAEEKMTNDVEEARKQALEEKSQRESLQQKYDSVKDQLVELEIKSKQALDVIHSRNNSEPSESGNEDAISTEKEAELYTELLATKVALKAAEDQIQNYNREKLRFIDSIQSFQGDPEKDQEYVAKTMIKNVEKITELETRLTESEQTICNQKIEISNLKADIENLQQYPIINSFELDKPTKDSDLKMMLHEGRIKLEQSLKKSLEYEHKLIRYEHDLNRQSKQIYEMENLLKVRDGLISMMKAKKDELQMENDSLNKYANEIRDLLLQAKEEARNRTELVQELSTNLDSRGRICQQLEKKVRELEGSLSATNEKTLQTARINWSNGKRIAINQSTV
ncbi:hypothetical protein ILUMI_25261 [Ignelater luminosus]|uniref:Uncharacterized protein n=1 Tax=Ignelater luminosus TaxID=2038154 RepID=A0A8K0CAW3_IGNLU|nr:hypothetical protein ILUMI_25261 [Ignelater luminosus]